jgi:hypothetical protein
VTTQPWFEFVWKEQSVELTRPVWDAVAVLSVQPLGEVVEVEEAGVRRRRGGCTYGFGVEGHLVISNLVDTFEGVDLAALRPVWSLAPPCGPYANEGHE